MYGQVTASLGAGRAAWSVRDAVGGRGTIVVSGVVRLVQGSGAK